MPSPIFVVKHLCGSILQRSNRKLASLVHVKIYHTTRPTRCHCVWLVLSHLYNWTKILNLKYTLEIPFQAKFVVSALHVVSSSIFHMQRCPFYITRGVWNAMSSSETTKNLLWQGQRRRQRRKLARHAMNGSSESNYDIGRNHDNPAIGSRLLVTAWTAILLTPR